MPKVSVIMPVYNAEMTVRRAISSVQNQTLSDFELIVVDDASTDSTAEIVANIAAADQRVTLTSLPTNGGVGHARRVAVTQCVGDWITPLDADDWFDAPDRLDVLSRAADDLNADLIIDNLRIFDHALGRVVDEATFFQEQTGSRKLTPEMLFRLDNPLSLYPIGYAKPMVRTAFLKYKNINYDPTYRVGEDFLFLAEVLLNEAKAFLVPQAGYNYVHHLSPSTNKTSPHSRTDNASNAFELRLCDEMFGKYQGFMTHETKTALLKKRSLAEDSMNYFKITAAARRKDILTITKTLWQRPTVLKFGLLFRARHFSIKARLRRYQPSQPVKSFPEHELAPHLDRELSL